ncbi:MAG: hypothetical protein IPO59_22105 [Betaproteobacteria bacterium]|nr:hypothetical protein [Betaproteobacteria bacterium]
MRALQRRPRAEAGAVPGWPRAREPVLPCRRSQQGAKGPTHRRTPETRAQRRWCRSCVLCHAKNGANDVRAGHRRRHALRLFSRGLESETKKDIQQRFMQGELAVIAATNAFGMGVDKPDIRVVIHADIPGSLENYLQEAGRAGTVWRPLRAAGRPGGRRDAIPPICDVAVDQEGLQQSAQGDSHLVGGLKSSEIVVSAKELLSESEGTTIDTMPGRLDQGHHGDRLAGAQRLPSSATRTTAACSQPACAWPRSRKR